MEYEHFRTFLDQLFLDGITRERIVILFTFCADVLLRAYDSAFSNLKKLFDWFLVYIIEKVCAWVESHGGWVCCLERSPSQSLANNLMVSICRAKCSVCTCHNSRRLCSA